MKRGNFIRELVKSGCYLKRHGKKHDIYGNSTNGKKRLSLVILKSKKVYAI